MQSGYGVPEIQQFVVDGCCSSLFSMSNDMNNNGSSQHGKNHHHQHQQHHHQQQQQNRFHHHIHQIPITQQFFQQHQQFQAFQQHHHQQEQQRRLHQQLCLDQESGPENSNSPSRVVGGAGPNFIAAAAAVNFKLAAGNENSGSREALNEEDAMIRGDDGSDSRVHRWNREQDSAIKEPFWKPLDIDLIGRNAKRCNEKLEISNKFLKKSDEGNENEDGKNSGSNYGGLVFGGELEAICAGGAVVGNNQTGSGSALTGDNPPATATMPGPTGNNPRSSGIDHGSETSTGEEASLKKVQKSKRKRKRKQLSSIATFFESLVTQLMDHQENLHRKFLEVMEKRDEERSNREEAWRRQEAAKANREAMARAQEQALASSREAAIVSFLEKITGESINLPNKAQFQFQYQITEESNKEDKQIEEQPPSNGFNINVANNFNNTNSRRWPKVEVQALIRVRSGLESRFQEQGLKGPLWDEVSTSMASMGYQRSAKRCKEKWENINKYFRKTKDSSKKRPQHSKTCPYFHQLDQLYSRPLKIASPNPSAAVEQRNDNLELLDAIVVATDHGNAQNPSLELVREQLEMSRNFKFTETGPLRLDFGNNVNDNYNEGSSSKVGKELDIGDEEDVDEEDNEEGDEEEGDGDNEEHVKEQDHEREHVVKEQPQDIAFFRLVS